MPLSTLFQLYRGDKFYWWRKLEYPENTTDLSRVTDKLCHKMLYGIKDIDLPQERGILQLLSISVQI